MDPRSNSASYQIRVKGEIDERWLRRFDGLAIQIDPEGETVILGALDQSALHGVLDRIRDLGLELISVQQIGDEKSEH